MVHRSVVLRWLTIALVCSVALLPVIGAAQHGAPGWQPSPPIPDDFDWVQLTSGEWLKGEIIGLYDEVLEFESDKLDRLQLDWKDVQQLRSAQTMEVAFDDGEVVRGKVVVEEETITLLDGEPRRHPRTKVVTIASAASRRIDAWSADVSLGLTLRSGNTEQLQATGQAELVRRTAKDRLSFDLMASFDESDGVTTSDTQRATVTWQIFSSQRLFWVPLSAEGYRDPFQNITGRWKIGAGLGYSLVDHNKASWRVSAGLAYQRTVFGAVEEAASDVAETPALVLSSEYERDLTSWLELDVDLDVTMVDEASGRYTHHLDVGLDVDITKLLELDVTFVWDRTENPQADDTGVVPEQDDFRLLTSIGFEF